MNFSPCIVIPLYNHGAALALTVQRLAAHGLPIYVVDDGSDEATRLALLQVASVQPLVRASRLDVNCGKGVAVMSGMRQAFADGRTHALQVDADGQHDPSDVPAFVGQARMHPDALICGKPIYDMSVPKGRLYGRYVTHFWVWIETLSFDIADSMCGYRLYPLEPTCRLIDTVRIPSRMDFDTEIAVRLHWRGLPVINLPTRVVYPPGGLSHFRMLRDNVRISWMHTRLVAGMLVRAPLLLWRKFVKRPPAPYGAPGATHWSARGERGSTMGLRLLLGCYRLLGDRAAQLVMLPVIGYFLVTGGDARRASRQYLQRVHQVQKAAGKSPGLWQSWRHMRAFGRSSLDKLAAWSGVITHSEVAFEGQDVLDELLRSGKGALLVSAHLGNLEMTRALAARLPSVTVTAVVYTEHAQRFNESLASVNPAFSTNLLQVSTLGPDTAMMLQDRVARGELVVIVGDRTPPAAGGAADRVSHVNFLGRPAPFAHGPWILASLLECPVYLFFCLREPDGYRIHLESFAPRVVLRRGQRRTDLDAITARFATRLEAYCLRAPLQWFNFFDFWRTLPVRGSRSDP